MFDGQEDIRSAWLAGMRPTPGPAFRVSPMDPELRARMERYPLPESVEDAVLNRTQIAYALETSENTITKWLARGMPCLQEGSNGRDYQFQLSHCFAWLMHSRDEEDEARRSADSAAAQMRLAFQNLDDDKAELERGLTARQIGEIAEADYKRNRAAEQRGELVRADRMRALQEQQLIDIRQGVMALPDFAEQEFGLTAQQAEKLQTRCENILVEMALTMRRYLGEGQPAEAVDIGQAKMSRLI